MKNLFKFGFLTLVIALTAAACDPGTKSSSTTTDNPGDSVKKDSGKVDSVKIDSAKADSTKK